MNTSDEIIVFFDTEFSNLERPELISLGAVTADGEKEFYAEVSPIPDGCSDFVKERVLPLRTGPAISREELKDTFVKWLRDLGGDIELMSDSDYDRNILYDLCGYPPVPDVFCRWFPLPHSGANNPHHALEDARLLRKEFVGRL